MEMVWQTTCSLVYARGLVLVGSVAVCVCVCMCVYGQFEWVSDQAVICVHVDIQGLLDPYKQLFIYTDRGGTGVAGVIAPIYMICQKYK